MVTNTLPPQAYTRDVLVKAIEWIATQPASLRERATSADLVVSFYLQSRRKMAQMEAPISGENFKTDLKNLVENLKQFDEPIVPPQPVRPPTPSPSEVPLSEAPGLNWRVDARSLAAARELQDRFNLSNETEALRMLVILGLERAKTMGFSS